MPPNNLLAAVCFAASYSSGEIPEPLSARDIFYATSERPTGGGRIAPAGYGSKVLGLRYSVLKLLGNEKLELSPDSVFHSGDRIQLNIEVNDAGYLYILHRGSSGAWKPMFPLNVRNIPVKATRVRFMFTDRLLLASSSLRPMC